MALMLLSLLFTPLVLVTLTRLYLHMRTISQPVGAPRPLYRRAYISRRRQRACDFSAARVGVAARPNRVKYYNSLGRGRRQRASQPMRQDGRKNGDAGGNR